MTSSPSDLLPDSGLPISLRCTALDDAARRLNAGGLLVYPTETFYGIGCRADHDDAVLRIFKAKRRAPDMPLPLILSSASQLPLVTDLDAGLKDAVLRLSAFWPAPITLLMPVRPGLPSALTAGTGKVAVRVSAHPAARALAEACDFPVVSSSANISGRPAVTDAACLDPELLAFLCSGSAPNGVFDPRHVFPEATPPSGGMASTIVEPKPGSASSCSLRVLRQGAFPLSSLVEAGFTLLP